MHNRSDRLEVVPYRSAGIKRVLWWAMIISYFMVGGTALWTGFQLGVRHMAFDTQKLIALEQANQNLRQQLDVGQAELAKLHQTSGIDGKTIELLRQDNKAFSEKLEALKEEVSYYKRVVNPGQEAQGLVIGRLNIKASPVPRRYKFNIDVIQVSGRKKVSGQLSLNLSGALNQAPAKLALSDLNEDYKQSGIALSFFNYQAIEGELQLPEAFIPDQVEVITQFTQGKRITLKEVFDWTVQE